MMDACYFCKRRPVEVNVDFAGKIVGVCDTCWDRAEDERRRDMEQAEYDERNPPLEDSMEYER
jgi:hypothetical protein